MKAERGSNRFVVVLFCSLLLGLSGYAASTGYQLVNAFGSLTFTSPLCLSTPPGETNRIFVLEKTGFGIAVFDTEFLEPTFARLIADRTVERVIDQQKFHDTALTFAD